MCIRDRAIVTFTATDDCDNASSFQATFTIEDTAPPTVTISCPADYSVNADGSCSADTTPTAAGEATATASDNCDATVTASVTYSDGAQTATCEGAYSFVRT